MTTRVSPPAAGANYITVFGRFYTCAVGATLDVPDGDASVMLANGWVVHGQVTTTANRPNPATYPLGKPFIDSTLGYAIFSDGKQWRHSGSGALV